MTQTIHTLDSHINLVHDDVTLFSYVYNSRAPAVESPRPYFHPLRTLKGNVVSGFRPHDHRWHHGLSMTCANLSGHNFWGGPTYLRDKGYVQLNNVGEQKQVGWGEKMVRPPRKPYNLADDSFDIRFDQIHRWQLSRGNILMNESRKLRVAFGVDHYEIHFGSEFYGLEQPLIWGSPTTQGRENAGYGGLFWRGPRDFIGGQILMSDNRQGADLMGQSSPWLAYIGQHDETDDYSTLIFVDDKCNPRHPTPWFARNSTPMVCPYFAFHDEYEQQPGEVLRLDYRIIIADGKWNRKQIEAAI